MRQVILTDGRVSGRIGAVLRQVASSHLATRKDKQEKPRLFFHLSPLWGNLVNQKSGDAGRKNDTNLVNLVLPN